MKLRCGLLSAALLAMTLACTPSNDVPPRASSTEAKAESPQVTVEVKSLAEVEQLIASQGKPVVLDLWALW